MMEKAMKLDKIEMGICYYPEHWDESLWESDLARMLEHGIHTIRIAEFAWNKFEPREGEFTFDFFDRFLEAVSKTEMKVIFCTPTATPPAWASHKYPEILNAEKDGTILRHGHRRHYNYNSPVYQRLTRIIVEKIAEHYGSHPSIIGWQIDNEINCEIDEFYSESDSAAFRTFLKNKYGTLEALNQAWGTVFWNQDYTEWEQVFVPRPTPAAEGNPHQRLDYIRFISESAYQYMKLQADILKQYLSDGVYITTNGLFDKVDNHRQTRDNLDFMMYDSYPNFAYCLGEDPKHSASLNDRKWGMKLSEVRSMSPNFGVMEQQSGANGWTFRMEAPSPKPGQMTLWTMQSVAHGADYISYFRWRTCTVGTEIYWHGILDYDNRDNRRLRETKEISKKFEAIAEVAGSRYQARFAVLKEYGNTWDTEYDMWHNRVEKLSQQGWFNAAQLTHTPMDYLFLTEDSTAADLAQYPVLVFPHATILEPATAELLKQYVADGGTLIMGCRSGYKDGNGHCVMMPKPGLVSDLFGCDVEDFTFVGPNDDPVGAVWDGETIDAPMFHDILQSVDGGTVEAVYDGDYYKGAPALVKNSYGKGTAYYFGGAFSTDTAVSFLRRLGIIAPYRDLLEVPEGCELAVRRKDGRDYFFVLNYAHEDAVIELKTEMTDLYTGAQKKGRIVLGKYETCVFKLSGK